MRITVLTPAYNAADTIGETISSVRAQTHPDVEHIIIDGASRDSTAEIVMANSARVARFVTEPDQGMYDALNKGLKWATGDVIGILNADDAYATPESLSTIVTAFETTAADVCYGDLLYVDRQNPDRIVRYWRSGPMKPGQVGRGWYPPHPTFFVKRRVYDQFGGYDLDFGTAADVEMMIRILGRYKLPAHYIPDVLVRMRTGGVSNRTMLGILAQNLQLYRAFRKNHVEYSRLFPLRKLPSRLMQFIRRP